MVAHTRLPSLEDLPPQRRSTTVAALRRGQIKISEPVPVENSGPSPVWKSPTSSAFAHDSVTGFGTVDGVVPHQQALTETNEQQLHAESRQAPSFVELRPDPYNPPKTSHGVPLKHKRSSILMRDTNDGGLSISGASSQQRSSTNESMADFTMSPTSNKKKRRSGGSIRLAFRKIFKPKDRPPPRPTTPTTPIRPIGRGHEYHKSESALLSPSSRNGLGKVPEERISPHRHAPKRTEPEDDYLSQTQINTPRLPFPMNVNAPQLSPYKNTDERQTEDSTGSPVSHRRRATLPSIVLSPAEAATLTRHWAKGEGENTTQHDQVRTPSPLIGLAITSNMSSKRRSRSADALHDMAASQGLTDVRRRSAEIQYWRSTNHGIPETEEQEKDLRRSQSASIKEINEIIPPSLSNSSTADVSHQSHAPSHNGSHHTEIEAVEPGTRSIEPTDNHDQRPISTEVETMNRVDQRLSQIELNMAQLAHSMQALSERDSTRAFKLEKAPKGNARASSVDQTRTHGLPSNPREVLIARATSLKSPNSPKPRHPRPSPSCNDLPIQQTLIEEPGTPIPTATAIPHDGNSPLPTQTTAPPFPRSQHHQHANIHAHRETNRDASSTPQTIIHNFSTPYALHHNSTNTMASPTPQPQPQPQSQPQHSPTWLIDQLAPVYNSLRYERAERKRLEAQVLQLQHDLLDLATIIGQQLGIATTSAMAYPTPSPDALLMAHMTRSGGGGLGAGPPGTGPVKGGTGAVDELVGGGSSGVGGAGSAGGSMASGDEMGEYGLGRGSPGEWAREAREAREVGVGVGDDWQGEMF